MPEDRCSGPALAPIRAGCGLLACSPRPGGNSDAAARLFAEGYAAACAAKPQVVFLRDYAVLPCTACDACLRAIQKGLPALPPAGSPLHALFGQTPGDSPIPGCPLPARDDSATLLALLAEAPALCLVSPIYFYHLPALLKALIDRTQPFWQLYNLGISPLSGRERICHSILLGARERGEHLFAGSLLTLKYALAGLNIRLAEPLLLHGLDSPDDLVENSELRERVRRYGRLAAAQNGVESKSGPL